MGHYDDVREEMETCFQEEYKAKTPVAPPPFNKYAKYCKGITIDVYDVLKAFDVRCPAMQHAIKKMLCTGTRGSKGFQQDADEAIESIKRSKELNNE